MNPLRLLRSLPRKPPKDEQLARIYERFADFTMIPRPIYLDNLRLAERVASLPGCIVECGVWRGGMSAGLATVLGPERAYFLCDSFEGLPPAKEIDGEAAARWQRDTTSPFYYENCAAPADFAERAMNAAGIAAPHLIKGWFEHTLPGFIPPVPIALLRLDADWYESTIVCLEALVDHVAPGGLIVLDDYYTWDGCSRAVHDFLSRRSAPERIRSLNDTCYLVKTPPPA